MIGWTISQTGMTRQRPHAQGCIVDAGQYRERLVMGADVAWPSIGTVSASEDFRAERVSWHKHDRHELLMLLSGATEYEFQGGNRVALAGEQFMVVPPGLLHRGVKDLRGPAVHCAITIDFSASRSSGGPFTRREIAWLAGRFARTGPVARAMGPSLRRISRSFHGSVRQFPKHPPSPDVCAELRLQIAHILVEAARNSGDHPTTNEADTVALAKAHLESHFASPLLMNDVAQQIGCSRSRLYAIFKRETGMSPNDWLQRLRIKKAEELLTTTNLTLLDVAAAVGFATQAYFCHVFRKYSGKTPGDCRANAR